METSNPYPHLNANAAIMADQPDELRIDYIQKDRFLAHQQAEKILDELERLYRMDDAVRPQGRLLVGRSLMGKSTIIDEFLKNHRATDNPDGEAAIVPVLSIQYPDTAKEGIYPEILRKLNATPSSNAKPNQVRSDAISLVRAIGCRVIIIDEIHNLLEGSAVAQRKGLNSIKYLMNELRRPVVAAGTTEAINAVNSDEQISSRLKLLPLLRFEDDEDFQELLAMFELVLPLQRPSCLADPALSSLIHQYTLGITGDVSDLLSAAATLAIQTGTEQITKDEIEACKLNKSKNVYDIKGLL